MSCNANVETQYIGDLQLDMLNSVPDYFIAERDVVDPNTGETVRSLVRVPGQKILPNGNLDNVIALEPNNVAIEVPENQVRAGYVKNGGSANSIEYADADHKPVFLMVGEVANQMLIQSTGFIGIPKGHSYIVGVQYYVGENGEPVTSSDSGYKLFIPVSQNYLRINME